MQSLFLLLLKKYWRLHCFYTVYGLHATQTDIQSAEYTITGDTAKL